MCLSVFLAQLIGIYALFTALAMLVHQERFKKNMHEFISNHSMIAFSGALHLLLGLLIVLTHNIWVSQWPVLITIVGWLLVLGGLMRMFYPERFIHYARELMAKSGYQVVAWVWLLVGVYLIWMGFQGN